MRYIFEVIGWWRQKYKIKCFCSTKKVSTYHPQK